MLLSSAFAICFLVQSAPQNNGMMWISVFSREGATPPSLRITDSSGQSAESRPAADTVLISYLPDRPWPNLPTLAISLGDTNRSLLRFDVPAGPALTKAVLVLTIETTQQPPVVAFDISIHPVLDAWDDQAATWERAPRFAETPAATATIAPGAVTLRIDVTEAVNAWRADPAKNYGWLLKVANPLPVPQMPPNPDRAFERELLAAFPWAADLPAAKARAADENKLVLAVLRTGYQDDEANVLEQMLLAINFADPEVRNLIESCFVPVRLRVLAEQFMHRQTPAAAASTDPLLPIGTRLTNARPLAIVVATGDGRHVATLADIATFDPGAFHRFLQGALRNAPQAPTPRAPEAPTGAPAAIPSVQAQVDAAPDAAATSYARAAEQYRIGKRADALRVWKELAVADPPDPFSLKSKARLAWPEVMAAYEYFEPSESRTADGQTSTPVAPIDDLTVIRRGVAYLLDQQRPDGSWPNGSMPAWDAAVTALVGKALLSARPALDETLRARVAASLERAHAWIATYVGTTDPQTADSFSTAYVLDYFLDRLAEDRATHRDAAQAAVKLLLAGQCPNGAWSYNLQFGTSWKGGFGGWPQTDQGRTHSMNTGPALLFLARARALGLSVPDDALIRGRDALLKMRKSPAVYTYTYPVPESFTEPQQSIGRAPACEQALVMLGAAAPDDLRRALDLFRRHRAGLAEPVRLTASWSSSVGSSSYFYFFAYYHAARAMTDLAASHLVPTGTLGDQLLLDPTSFDGSGSGEFQRPLADIRSEILRVREADGTWVDFEQVGKPYGTAMALLILQLTEPQVMNHSGR